MLFISSLFALLSLPLVFAKNYNVDVGREGVAFTPNRIQNVVKGDTVTFHVINGEHTITQSTLTVPCTHSNAGFDSGIVDAGETFKIDIKDTEPIWVFCRTRGHCPAGMVFAVNPGDKFSQFQNNAAGSGVHPTLSPSSITDSLTSPTTTISSTSDSGSPLPPSSSLSSTSTTRLTGSDEGTTTRTVSTPAASAITTVPASNNNGVGPSSIPLLAPATLLATLLGLGMAIVF